VLKYRTIPAVVVEVFCGGQSQLLFFEREVFVFFQEIFDNVAVLIFLNAACAVADQSGRLYKPGGG
jgi:hypothetical protein